MQHERLCPETSVVLQGEATRCQTALVGLAPGLECVLTSDLDQSRAVAHPWMFVSQQTAW